MLNALAPLRRILVYAGAYSYGVYLLHQPYVMYIGGRLSALGMPAALRVLCFALAGIVCGSSLAEKSLNRITGRSSGRWPNMDPNYCRPAGSSSKTTGPRQAPARSRSSSRRGGGLCQAMTNSL